MFRRQPKAVSTSLPCILALVGLIAGSGLSACLTNDRGVAHGKFRHITLLATNDIHGHVEAETIESGPEQGKLRGGLAYFGGIVKSIRAGLRTQHGINADVIVLDAGDQFQGTLLSNFSEGELVFDAMNSVGYDAAVPGNHDYDFGPKGWLDDRVTASTSQNPREVIELLVRRARFPLISANTYLKSSIQDYHHRPVNVESSYCKPSADDDAINFALAQVPAFLQPYVVKEVAGVRVALIGLDNPATPLTTTAGNVTDLCFRDPYETYRDIRKTLEGKADIFVLIIHDGNTSGEAGMTALVERISKIETPTGHALHAVIAGHTHQSNNVTVEAKEHKIPAIQSEHSANKFGRIDLVWNTETKTTDATQMRQFAALEMKHGDCDSRALRTGFCTIIDGQVAYENSTVVPDRDILRLTARAREALAPVARRVMGVAETKLKVDRISESPLANVLTDSFRAASNADVAFLNTGGIRTAIPAGTVTYEQLFEVLPFANHGLVIGPMKTSQLLGLLQRSIETCGSYGALMQSGLRVVFARDCQTGTRDPAARLLHVETVTGEVILDVASGRRTTDIRQFTVATLDFLASGGSGFDGFRGTPLLQDLGIIREVLADEFAIHPVRWTGELDGRWKQQ